MISYQEALQVILQAIPEPGRFRISTKNALGEVLAEDVAITRDFPEMRLSAVDGYAFKAGDQDWYRIMGEVGAGSVPSFSLQTGQCAAVMTGAPVPQGTDCVVRIENCEEKPGQARSTAPLKPGDLINEKASEAEKGKILLQTGAVLNKSVFPTLFYAGVSEVAVYKRPKIGMLLTGNELCDVDELLQKGQVFDTNCYILEAFLQAINLEITVQRRVKDDDAATGEALDSLAETCDFIVSSGGVSMGRYDYIKKNLQEGNFQLLIQGTGIKPGRPLMVAEKNGRLFFGMPGYPSAFLTNCLVYLLPALKKACGRSSYNPRLITATLATPMKSRKGRLYLNRARLDLENGHWVARNPGSQKTSHFLNVAEVNGLAFLNEEMGNLEVGAQVKCLLFDLELC